MTKFIPFNAADYLRSEEECQAYLEEFPEGDPLREVALKDVEKARQHPEFGKK